MLLILVATRAVAAPCPTGQPAARDADDRSDADPPIDAASAPEALDPDEVRALAQLADEPAAAAEDERAAIATGVVFDSAVFDDPAALRDLELRHQRPSRWGRLDLSVTWRRAWDGRLAVDPTLGLPRYQITRGDTLWLVATWRR